MTAVFSVLVAAIIGLLHLVWSNIAKEPWAVAMLVWSHDKDKTL